MDKIYSLRFDELPQKIVFYIDITGCSQDRLNFSNLLVWNTFVCWKCRLSKGRKQNTRNYDRVSLKFCPTSNAMVGQKPATVNRLPDCLWSLMRFFCNRSSNIVYLWRSEKAHTVRVWTTRGFRKLIRATNLPVKDSMNFSYLRSTEVGRYLYLPSLLDDKTSQRKAPQRENRTK